MTLTSNVVLHRFNHTVYVKFANLSKNFYEKFKRFACQTWKFAIELFQHWRSAVDLYRWKDILVGDIERAKCHLRLAYGYVRVSWKEFYLISGNKIRVEGFERSDDWEKMPRDENA